VCEAEEKEAKEYTIQFSTKLFSVIFAISFRYGCCSQYWIKHRETKRFFSMPLSCLVSVLCALSSFCLFHQASVAIQYNRTSLMPSSSFSLSFNKRA